MSRLLIIIILVSLYSNISCGQDTNSQKRKPVQTEKHTDHVRPDFGDNKTRDSLVKMFGDSIFLDISFRDAGIREIFGKPVNWDSGEFVSTIKSLEIPQKPLGWTTDYEGIFTQTQVDSLNTLISKFQEETTAEIAIVTIDKSWTTKEKFDSSILALFNYWGMGKKVKNNGVLLGVSAGQRIIHISNGYGIELKLSNSETKAIIDNTIIPYFKDGNYFEGVRQGLLATMVNLR